MTNPVCDYTHYNYKETFWGSKRAYEHLIESITLRRLFKKIAPLDAIMDAGCGFGRLFEVYEPFAQQFVLMDYAETMLAEAKNTIRTQKPIRFLQGNLYEIPVEAGVMNCVMSIRTLHHIVDPTAFFKEVNRVLKPNGYFIFEIPNQRHILNILRFLFKKQQNPFSLKPIIYQKTYLNYHPKYIKELLKHTGFRVIKKRNLSFFRSDVLKRIIRPQVLVGFDLLLQPLFSFLDLAPSIYILCQKQSSLGV